MDYVKIRKQLIEHEGMRLKPYKCPAGKLTIGIGRNIEDKGITEAEAFELLFNDVNECIGDLWGIFPWFDKYPENIQLVLVDMRFQLGSKGFRGFRLMIRAVENMDWPEMIRQMRDSAWYGQTPNRANNLIRLVQKVI
jgi:lysozyme